MLTPTERDALEAYERKLEQTKAYNADRRAAGKAAKVKLDAGAVLTPTERDALEAYERKLERNRDDVRNRHDAGKAAKAKRDAGAVLTPAERDALEVYERKLERDRTRQAKKVAEIRQHALRELQKFCKGRRVEDRSLSDIITIAGELALDLDILARSTNRADGADENQPLGVTVSVSSEGGKRDVVAEGKVAGITGRGGIPAVHYEKKPKGSSYGRGTSGLEMNFAEREAFGLHQDAFEIFDAKWSKEDVDRLEHALQVTIELLAPQLRLQPFWICAGSGGASGLGPYKLGIRFFRLGPKGELPPGLVYNEKLKRTKF